jgi:O-antigen/teichoic acid export membrane protein
VFLCGLILPRFYISHYGSEANGLVNSINQFLNYIMLLESGVGGVIRAAFYKPLAEQDSKKLSGIVTAGSKFFQKIGLLFVGYVIVLAFVYPKMVSSSFSSFFTGSLVMILGISIFFQYYFGLINQILIQADQKVWITSLTQIVTVLLNAIVVCVMITKGASLHMVKLVSTLIFVIRPMTYFFYVKKHYKIDAKAPADEDAISQKWDGLGQHIAFFVHTNTDVVILSLLNTLKNVSVYSIYQGIISGIGNIVSCLSQGIVSTLGNMLALHEDKTLHTTFDMYELMNSMLVSAFYSTTILCIIPFVRIYMSGVTDANYIQPVFACILIASAAVCSFRSPYSDICFAAGHYKQTSFGAYLEVGLNVSISLLLVKRYTLTGIAIGTLIAITSRTFYYIFYLKKNLLQRKPSKAFAAMGVTLLSVLCCYGFVRFVIRFEISNFMLWIAYGFISLIICSLITFVVFFVFYRERTKALVKKSISVLKKRKD